MKYKPNGYRVTYQVMEGNNYAGGWGERIADIKELHEVSKFDDIISVHPMYIEVGDVPVEKSKIKAAIKKQGNIEAEEELTEDISRQQKKLNSLRKDQRKLQRLQLQRKKSKS